MESKEDIIKWLQDSPGTHVGIDDGGLTLVVCDGNGIAHKSGAYFEIGGLSPYAEDIFKKCYADYKRLDRWEEVGAIPDLDYEAWLTSTEGEVYAHRMGWFETYG